MTSVATDSPDKDRVLQFVSELIVSYVQHNSVPAGQLTNLIREVHMTLSTLAAEKVDPAVPTPAVPVKRSITPEYLICLEDGKKLKILKRYLRSHFNLSPDQYRAKWGLPASYPMVAPNYAKQRSNFAKEIGLGQAKGKPRRRRKGN